MYYRPTKCRIIDVLRDDHAKGSPDLEFEVGPGEQIVQVFREMIQDPEVPRDGSHRDRLKSCYRLVLQGPVEAVVERSEKVVDRPRPHYQPTREDFEELCRDPRSPFRLEPEPRSQPFLEGLPDIVGPAVAAYQHSRENPSTSAMGEAGLMVEALLEKFVSLTDVWSLTTLETEGGRRACRGILLDTIKTLQPLLPGAIPLAELTAVHFQQLDKREAEKS